MPGRRAPDPAGGAALDPGADAWSAVMAIRSLFGVSPAPRLPGRGGGAPKGAGPRGRSVGPGAPIRSSQPGPDWPATADVTSLQTPDVSRPRVNST